MFALLFALSGCGLFISAEGNWDGTCTGGGYSVPVLLDISSDKGGDISGDFTVTASGYLLLGDVSGVRAGTDLDLDIALNESGYILPTRFKAEIDGDDMDATWTLGAGGYSTAFDCDLSR